MIEIITGSKYKLEQRLVPVEDTLENIGKEGPVCGTFLNGKLWLRCAGEPELEPGEYHILYIGRKETRGIFAGIHAVLPPEAWQDGDSLPETFEVVFLGVCVRFQCDMVVGGVDENEESVAHFEAHPGGWHCTRASEGFGKSAQ